MYSCLKFTFIFDGQVLEVSRYLEETNVPEYINKRKDPKKEPPPRKYTPITRLPMMWTIYKKTQIMKEIYYSLISRELFPEKKKSCLKKQEERVIYCTLFNTSSRRAKDDV